MKNMIRFAALICLCALSFAASAGDRWMQWRGLDNARDFGGLQTTGSRLVRTNRIYRSQSFNDAAISDELTASRLKSGLVAATLPLAYGRANSDEIVLLVNRDDLTVGCQKVADRLSADQSLWRTGAPRGTAESRAAILAATGLKTEIDLRNDSECYGMTGSPLGDSVNWVHLPAGQTLAWYVTTEGKTFFRSCFQHFLNDANYPIAIHGLHGAERTGRLAFVLGALLGVKESQLTDDYARTSATSAGPCSADTIRSEESAFNSYSGSTLNERVAAYALDCGFSSEDLETYRALVLEPGEEADEEPTEELPAVFEKLAYLEATGTQYIDTGYKPNINSQIYFKFACFDVVNSLQLFGCVSGNNRLRVQRRNTAGAIEDGLCFVDMSNGGENFSTKTGTPDSDIHEIFASNALKTYDGEEFGGTETKPLSVTIDKTLWLMKYNNFSSGVPFVGRVYACKISEDNELKMDLVPARNKVTNDAGLYDRVSGCFLTNAGTGTFVVPPAPVKPHGKIRIVQICDPQFGFVTVNIPDRTAANHEKYYAQDLAAFKKMIPRVNAEKADLVVIAGDLVQYSDEFTRDWPALLQQFTAPVLIVPGNHDLGAWNQAKTQFDSNSAYEQSLKDFISLVGYGWDSRVIGNWRIVGMNSQFWQPLDGSAYMAEQKSLHEAWYNEQLSAAAANGQGLIVVSHVAPFVSAVNEADSHFNFPTTVRTELLDQAVGYGGVAWLAGHSHLHRKNTYGNLNIYIGEAMCANYESGGWPRGYTVFEVSDNSIAQTWTDVTETDWTDPADDLLLHYRADTGVTTNEAGKVTAWKNLGTLGTAGDVTEVVDQNNASCASDVTLSAAGANGRASLVFGGASCLKTVGDIDFATDSTRGACWFVALKSSIDYSIQENRCVMGLVDKGNSNPQTRFGVFHASGDMNAKVFRAFAFQSGIYQINNCPDDWFVMSHSEWATTSTASSGYNGVYTSFSPNTDHDREIGARSVIGPFFVGKLGDKTWPIFKGEIAEIRCYSRALTPSERTAVQMEMSLAAGVEASATSFKGIGLFQAANGAYRHDAVAFGYVNSGPGDVVAAGKSGGLTMTLNGTIDKSANTVCYLAHDDAAGIARSWCVAMDGCNLTDSITVPLKLRLDREQSAAFSTGACLQYRASVSDDWITLAHATRNQDGTIGVTLASWQGGYYRFAEDSGESSLLLHYRADTGVTTNEAGKVTAWKNLGALGTAGDVSQVVDLNNDPCASDVTVSAAGANGRASLVFGGTSCLKTVGDIDFATDSTRGACWFVALKSSIDYSIQENRCVMGLVDKDSTIYRFGAFHASADVKNSFRVTAFQNVATVAPFFPPFIENCPDDWFVMSQSAWATTSSGYNGAYKTFNQQGVDGLAVGPFFVGKLGTQSWPIFKGEIAEIRCYSRALTPSERTAVQMEMGINAGVTVMDFGSLDLFADHADDVSCFGYAPNIGIAEVVSHVQSGGFEVGYAQTVPTDVNTLVCVAHNEAEGEEREWSIAADASLNSRASMYPLQISYLDAVMKGRYQLLYRCSTEDEWTVIGEFSRAKAKFKVTVTLSGWQNGYYRVKRRITGLCVRVK